MNKVKSVTSKIFSILSTLIMLFVLYKVYGIYKTYYFNDFIKAEVNTRVSTFRRDDKVKYSNDMSYMIESTTLNDAVFYKTLNVEKNTSYKVTCMVKTENIELEKTNSDAGANISIIGTTEISESITGTNDWRKLEFMFNSKNRKSVDIGFRLGGNMSEATGKVWFSDIKVEKGITNTDNNWKMVCFILKNINVNIDEKPIKLNMTYNDIETVYSNMQRFKKTCTEFSGNKMNIEYDIYEIDTPVTTISYSEEQGYYLDPYDVNSLIKDKILENEYDYIFVAARMGDSEKKIEIPVNDWIGLGGMDLYGIGFSNIRMSNSKTSYTYRYDSRINTFPEEVYLHEFLHSLERNLNEYEYKIPALHDNKEYGYEEQDLIGLKNWYKDYMMCNIKTSNNEKIGLNEIVYTIKPEHESNFKYTYEIEFNKEPENIIDNIKGLINVIKLVFVH